MKRTLFREKGNRWCEANISIENGRLSVTGSCGVSMSTDKARSEARRYWSDFFREDKAELGRMVADYGATSIRNAVDIVLRVDGAFHGLDVHKREGIRVYLTEGCGCIHDTLREWFPELASLIPYHLNDLHAECEHQEKRGESYSTHGDQVCPECGWKLGHGWSKRTLPTWVETLAREVAA